MLGKSELKELIDKVDEADKAEIATQIKRYLASKKAAAVPSAASAETSWFGVLDGQLRESEVTQIRIERNEENESRVCLIVTEVAPNEYQEFLTTALLCGRLSGAMKSSVATEDANSHTEQKIALFGQSQKRREWLNAEVSYDADNRVVRITIDTANEQIPESYTAEKGKQLIDGLTNYYEKELPLEFNIVFDATAFSEETNVEAETSEKAARSSANIEAESTSSVATAHPGSESYGDYDIDGEEDAGVGSTAEVGKGLEGSSGSSSQRVGKTTQLKEPFVQASVDCKGNVVVAVGKSRPKTNLEKGKQGDHVSAYIAFIEFALNTVRDKPIGEIPGLFLSYAGCFLSKAEMQQLEKKFEEVHFEDALPENYYLSRDEGRAYAKRLKDKGNTKEDIAIAKINVKRGYATLISNIVNKLVVHIIQTINLQEKATFIACGSKDTAEGTRVRVAIEALSALNTLMELHQLPKGDVTTSTHKKRTALQQRLTQEKRLRDGLRKFQFESMGKDRQPLLENSDFIEELINPSLVSERLTDSAGAGPSDAELISQAGLFSHQPTSSKQPAAAASSASALPGSLLQKTAGFIADLFDFNYYRRLSTVLLSNASFSAIAKRVESLLIDDTARQQFIMAVKLRANIELSESEAIAVKEVGIDPSMQNLVDTLRINPKSLELTLKNEEEILVEDLKAICQTHMGLMIAAFTYLHDYADVLAGGFMDCLMERSWENTSNSALLASFKEGIIRYTTEQVDRIARLQSVRLSKEPAPSFQLRG